MNKKRVALALAAALGVNTLMVTVGQVGEQMTVAHATQASGRLTTEQDEARRKAITIKKLDTTATNLANGNVEVTFNNIKTTDIKTVTATAFSQKKFTERENIDGINGAVTPTWANGKLTFSGIKEAGIYTGTVTIDYNNGDKETYTLSLVKKASDTFTIGSVDVRAGSIVIKDVKFNDTNLQNGDKLYIREKGSTTVLDTVEYDSTNGAVFNKGLTFDKGKVYEVVYKYGTGDLHEIVSQVMLVKEEAKVDAWATNSDPTAQSGFANKLISEVANDFGVSSSAVRVDIAGSTLLGGAASNEYKDVNYSVKVDEVDVLSYTQTNRYNGNRTFHGAGGAALDVKVNDQKTGEIGLKITDIKTLANGNVGNFVPYIDLKASSPLATVGFIGEYSIQVGKDNPQVYLDASAKITNASVATSGSNGYLNVTGGVSGFTSLDESVFTYVAQGLEHGYSKVDVAFTAKETPFGGTTKKTVSEWAAEVIAGTPVKPDSNGGPLEGKAVNTTIVLRKDDTAGKSIQAVFNKTSESTGELTLKGAQSLLATGFNPNDVVSKLSVSGAQKVGLIADGSTTDFTFSVEFNGNLPSTIDWTFTVDNKELVDRNSTFGGTLETSKGAVETVNFKDAVTTSNSNTSTINNQFELVAAFGNAVPTGATVGFENQNNLRVTFADLGNDNKTINAKVGAGSKYQGTYSAGIWVTQQPFTIVAKDAKSLSNTSASVVVDADFINKDDIAKVTGGVIQYSEKTVNGNTTTWSDWKDTTTKVEKSEVKEDAITKTVTGLTGGKTYKFRAVYDYNNGTTTQKVYSIETGEVTLPTSSSSSTITGSGGTTTGTSTGSTTITVTTSNSTLTGTSASVTLPSGFRYDSCKTPVAVTLKYKDKDGKIVTETKEQYSNVTARFNGNNVELNGLVPGKNYDEITVDYTDNNGRTRSIILRNIQTSTTVESDKYLANVYTVVFDRPADEAGYHFHLDNLKNKKVSLRDFLLNMLTEKEFVEKYKSTEEKIEALYNAIVNRTSDEAGKKFWVDEYKKVLAVYGSESTALRAIADRMVNENELKELADKMGVQW